MNTDKSVAFSLVPETSDAFVAYSTPNPVDNERRREEARSLLVEFLARRILAHLKVIEVSSKAA